MFSKEAPPVGQAIPCYVKSHGEVFSQDLVALFPTEAIFSGPQDEDTKVHPNEDTRQMRNSTSLKSNNQVMRL